MVDFASRGAVADSIDSDPSANARERCICRDAVRSNPVHARYLLRRMLQVSRQCTIVGQQQESCRIDIGTPHRNYPWQRLRKRRENRGASLGIARGGHQTRRFVIAPESGLLWRGNRVAINGQRVGCADQSGRMSHYNAAQSDPTGLDQTLGVTPRGHSGSRKKFGYALSFHRDFISRRTAPLI